VKVPLDTHVTVMGDVVTVGDEVVVAATGLSY
jgi:hypothetical protein